MWPATDSDPAYLDPSDLTLAFRYFRWHDALLAWWSCEGANFHLDGVCEVLSQSPFMVRPFDKLRTGKLTTNVMEQARHERKKDISLGKRQYPFVLSLSKDEWKFISHTFLQTRSREDLGNFIVCKRAVVEPHIA